MTISTKYNLGDLVYFLNRRGEIVPVTVKAVTVEVGYDAQDELPEDPVITYTLMHQGTLTEQFIFSSEEQAEIARKNGGTL